MSKTVTDLTFLQEATSGDRESMHRMINMYIEQANALVETIKTSYEKKDWKGVEKASHTLKGMMQYMGVGCIQDELKLIETHAQKKEDVAELMGLISKVEKTYAESFVELTKYIRENPLAKID